MRMRSIRATARCRSCSTSGFERVWIALHGPGGEDGTLQGALEYLGVPYTGSGVMGSAIGMDKLRTKRLAQAVGVATADYVVLRGPAGLRGCARAAAAAADREARDAGLERRHDQGRAGGGPAGRLRGRGRASRPLVFAEPWITGAEYTVAILQGAALPSIRIETPKTFYDYEAKYFRDDTRYFCPSGLSQPAEQHLANLALAAFEAVRRRGLGSRGFHDGRHGRPLLLEINTVPGMTEPQPGADGGARGRASTSMSSCGACSRPASPARSATRGR